MKNNANHTVKKSIKTVCYDDKIGFCKHLCLEKKNQTKTILQSSYRSKRTQNQMVQIVVRWW